MIGVVFPFTPFFVGLQELVNICNNYVPSHDIVLTAAILLAFYFT